MKKQWRLCFEGTGGLWEDLYSTVSQSGQTPPPCFWWVMRDRWEERRRRWGGGAASGSSWWAHLWWHHHGGVWLICLIARERHWCLEPDLYYAAERQKRERDNISVFTASQPASNSHTEQQGKETCCKRILACQKRWGDEWGGGSNRRGQEEVQEWWRTDLKTNDQVRPRGKNDPCSGAASPRWNLLSPSLQPDLERPTRLSQRSLARPPSDASDVKFSSEQG